MAYFIFNSTLSIPYYFMTFILLQFVGIGGPMVSLNMVTVVAHNWFDANERQLATTIGALVITMYLMCVLSDDHVASELV